MTGSSLRYGVFDIASNEGWVTVAIDVAIASFAVASIRSWWEHVGRERYPDAKTLTITTDCGGSSQLRQSHPPVEDRAAAPRRADGPCDLGLYLPARDQQVQHDRAHHLFSFIARDWRGQPLISRQAVVSLIGATTSTAGLKVHAQLEGSYPRGVKVSDAELAAVKNIAILRRRDRSTTTAEVHEHSDRSAASHQDRRPRRPPRRRW